jgi:hypothetical protein
LYWGIREKLVLESIYYDEEDKLGRYVPIDITKTDNILQRKPNRKNCFNAFDKWRIAPGQQRHLQDMLTSSYTRQESLSRSQQQKAVDAKQNEILDF